MLTVSDVKKGIVLLGSTSEIGLEIVKQLRPIPGCPLYIVGRNFPVTLDLMWPHGEIVVIDCDLESSPSVTSAIRKINAVPPFDIAIIAAGYLPNEFNDEDLSDIQKTLRINGESVVLFLSAFAKRLSDHGGGQILLVSSVAAVRPRIRNFTYGASKSVSDFFAIGLASKYRTKGVQVKVIRPGYVFTKMTKNFKPAPFAINTNLVAKIALDTLRGKKGVAYAPSILKLVLNVARVLPRRIFDLL